MSTSPVKRIGEQFYALQKFVRMGSLGLTRGAFRDALAGRLDALRTAVLDEIVNAHMAGQDQAEHDAQHRDG